MSAITLPNLDALHDADPFRDQKHPFAHLHPHGLFFTVLKNAVFQTYAVVGDESTKDVPLDDWDVISKSLVWQLRLGPQPQRSPTRQSYKNVALFAFSRLWAPVLKDLSTISLIRILERVLASQTSSHADAGRFSRDPSAAAADAYSIACEHASAHASRASASQFRRGRGGKDARVELGLVPTLQLRWRVATHTLWVSSYPAFIANTAYVVVEQAALFLGWASRARAWHSADRIVKSTSASSTERKAASIALIENEPTGDVLSRSLELVARGGSSVVVECIFAACGSFVWPGVGTTVLQLAGNLLCWAII